MTMIKGSKPEGNIYQKMLSKIITSAAEKNFNDQPNDSDVKRYKEIRKLTRQGEDYTTRCLLHYDYIKNHYTLIVADLSRQKESDADPKAIQQIVLVGQLKKLDNNGNTTDTGNNHSMFVLTILEKFIFSRPKFSQESVTALMVNYEDTRVKLTKTQLSKLKFAEKKQQKKTKHTHTHTHTLEQH